MPRPIKKTNAPTRPECEKALEEFVEACDNNLDFEKDTDRIFVRELMEAIKKVEAKTEVYLMTEGTFAGVEFGE
jgi:hypothetical protein